MQKDDAKVLPGLPAKDIQVDLLRISEGEDDKQRGKYERHEDV
jgi:hypothetical protein